ncbi:MAG: DUF5060 domain-containing protein [Candidatus Solibacter usitatus]|nr:DUF5060 domain-containing protein [Candidatus Solibacter usitatus]
MGARLLPLWIAAAAYSQTCPPTPAYSHCDLVFELNNAEAAAHPNPYLTVDLRAEFRSPRHRTFLLPAFWDGGRRLVIRFTPTGAGQWDYRVSGNIARFAGSTGSLNATESESPGFVKPANVRFFSYTEGFKPHLWMGDSLPRLAFLEAAQFQQIVDARAAQKFNHIRGLVLGGPAESARIFSEPDRFDPAHFRALDERILYMNRKGIVADLMLAAGDNHLTQLFPAWQQRERYIRYLVSRYAPLNITWQGVEDFESYTNGRELLKEIGTLLKKLDPYQHPRSTHARATSAPLIDDGWMDHLIYDSADNALGAVEHQLYPLPQVNVGIAGADAAELRKRLWNAWMNGQFVSVSGPLPAQAAEQMTAWFDFVSETRYWDLEPFFDVDGGRALALETIEHIVYLEKPGPVEALVEKHGYEIIWFNPLTGESVQEKKNFKGERFSGSPPDATHDWVLHLSREGKKEGMLKSYKFEARRIILQEVEQSTQKVPFDIELPAGDTISLSKPVAFAARLKRETRATRAMQYLWTAEVGTDGQGYRVAGSGAKGTLSIPPGIARHFPATMHLRLTGMNANGKVYSTDKIFQLTQ